VENHSFAQPKPLAHGPRLTLWPLQNLHIEPLQRLISDPIVRSHWRTRGAYWAPYQVQAQLARDVLVTAIATLGPKPSDPLVGLAEIIDPAFVDQRAQLSTVVGRRYLNSGVGIELALTLAEFAFDAYTFQKFQIEVHAVNDRLARGLRRLLDHEGTLKRHLNLHGEWIDVELYALWKDDLPRLKDRLLPKVKSAS
jgi:RimJ/RimL family protein N-acetyltransferase